MVLKFFTGQFFWIWNKETSGLYFLIMRFDKRLVYTIIVNHLYIFKHLSSCLLSSCMSVYRFKMYNIRKATFICMHPMYKNNHVCDSSIKWTLRYVLLLPLQWVEWSGSVGYSLQLYMTSASTCNQFSLEHVQFIISSAQFARWIIYCGNHHLFECLFAFILWSEETIVFTKILSF